jgi:predicted nucleic acid-binding protein
VHVSSLDQRTAALAIEHGLILASTDGDFARFPDLRWENPLATPNSLKSLS